VNGIGKKGRYCEICNHEEGSQHPKDQEYFTRKSPERYEYFDGSLENMETLDNGYLWEMCHRVCRMMIPT